MLISSLQQFVRLQKGIWVTFVLLLLLFQSAGNSLISPFSQDKVIEENVQYFRAAVAQSNTDSCE
jgi:hypothetical protein